MLLDDKLSWKPHIEHVRSKLTALTGALRKMGSCVPLKVRNTIYNSLVRPHLEYLIEVWGSAAKTNLIALQIAQNKIIKRLYNYDYLTPTELLYGNTKIMNVTQVFTYNTCILIKKILNKTFQTNIQLTVKKFKYNLRCKNKLYVRPPRTEKYGRKNVLFQGTHMYNNLPNEIKECVSINIYKKKLKQYLMR